MLGHAAITAGISKGSLGFRSIRAPDAAQRAALRGAVRCRAGPRLLAFEETGSRFCEAAASARAGRTASHRARDTAASVARRARCRIRFQTATLSHSRGAMRPRFASPSRRPARGDGAVGGARMLAMAPLEAGGEPTSRGKATARAQGKAQRLPALHRPPDRRPFRGAPVRPALALSAEGSLLESGPSSDRTRAG